MGSAGQVRIVLASRSPRRIELLGRLGVACHVVPADIDETPLPGETAREMVLRLSIGKATVVAVHHRESTVLAADTTVEVDDEILGQPVDDDDAARMLRRLSGRAHRVHTAVAVIDPSGSAPRTVTVTSLVTFHPLTEAALEWYVATGEPRGKAGAYAVQGLGASLVASVRGSMSNVIGLPVAETARLLGLARRGPGPR